MLQNGANDTPKLHRTAKAWTLRILAAEDNVLNRKVIELLILHTKHNYHFIGKRSKSVTAVQASDCNIVSVNIILEQARMIASLNKFSRKI